VSTPTGDIWAATGHFDVKVGDRVVVPLETPMENFQSKTLNRTFPVIYFTTQIRHEGEPAPAAAPAGEAPKPMVSHDSSAAAPVVVEKIAPPAGATSVAALWSGRKALSGKTVTVRGQVVKFNGGILGRNWMHLQDGSGTAADGTNDITVTSAEEAKVGDIVTVTGTVVTDKDFGAGYAYKAMIEGAKIVAR
jgi:hypothetical protein